MVWRKLLAGLGFGGVEADTVLTPTPGTPGGSLTGQVNLRVKSDTDIASITLILVAGGPGGLGVTGEKRSKLAPDMATLTEQGVKALPTYSWWGIYARAGTPRPIMDRMHAEITKAVRSADVTQKFVELFDMEVVLNSPAEFAAFTRSEQEHWGKVIRDNSLKPE